MSRVFTSILLMVLSCLAVAETDPGINDLYVKTYGDKNKQPIIFVHGGPGFHSWPFELTTAENLAKQGFYVIVYDERGQGRSKETTPTNFNYKTYADDIKAIIDTYSLKNVVLMGHSHGGPIVVNFDKQYPNIARKVVLVSAPIHFPSAINAIYENCARRYFSANDDKNLRDLSYIKTQLNLDPDLTEEQKTFLVGATFIHGIKCGLYSPAKSTEDAVQLKKLVKANPLKNPNGIQTAMQGFLKNENYIQKSYLDWVFENRERYCGIYGDEDGLFTPIELGVIANTLYNADENSRFTVVKGASHDIFIDQQSEFFNALKSTCKL